MRGRHRCRAARRDSVSALAGGHGVRGYVALESGEFLPQEGMMLGSPAAVAAWPPSVVLPCGPVPQRFDAPNDGVCASSGRDGGSARLSPPQHRR